MATRKTTNGRGRKSTTSSSRKTTSQRNSDAKAREEVRRAANRMYNRNKGKPVFWIVMLLILVIVAVVTCYALFVNPGILVNKNPVEIRPDESQENHTGEIHSDECIIDNTIFDEFQIHFLEFGNDKAGDSIYIKAGDKDILIDAGSRNGSAAVLEEQIDPFVKDKKLDYIIATHGDQDHISGFVGNESASIFRDYQVDNIIYNTYTNKSTSTYSKFLEGIEEKKSTGTNVIDAQTYFETDQLTAKPSSTIQLSDNVSMQILWNKFYFQKTGDENDYSVCTLFKYKSSTEEHNFLLTGDLELAGEKAMAEHYAKGSAYGTLPHCDLFKAGHHGSKTSSNDCLLDLITPDICCVCTCCGTDEYTGVTANQFPTQAFIDRIAKHTDRVYITTMLDTYEVMTAEKNASGKTTKTGVEIGKQYIHSSGFKSMNGRITVSCNGKHIGISATNNLTKLKDTEWFNSEITLDGVTQKVRNRPSQWT